MPLYCFDLYPQTSSLVPPVRSCIEHGMVKGHNGRSSAEVHKAIRAFELMRRHPGADHGLGAETGVVAGGR